MVIRMPLALMDASIRILCLEGVLAHIIAGTSGLNLDIQL